MKMIIISEVKNYIEKIKKIKDDFEKSKYVYDNDKNILISLNKQFKLVKNQEDFFNLNNILKQINIGNFYGKRRGYSAYCFDIYQYADKYTSFLYDDGVSRGKSKWENLYKVIEIKS